MGEPRVLAAEKYIAFWYSSIATIQNRGLTMTEIVPTLYMSLYSQILAFGWALQQVQLDREEPPL